MSSPATKVNLRHECIRVRGVVQGVGFRPTVWRIANDIGLRGSTINDAEGVLVDAWGTDDQIERFWKILGQIRAHKELWRLIFKHFRPRKGYKKMQKQLETLKIMLFRASGGPWGTPKPRV